MGKTKNCVFPGCKSDSRSAHLPHMKNVQFTAFPRPKRKPQSCRMWVEWLCQYKPGFKVENVNYDTFLCSKHLNDEFFRDQAHDIKLKPVGQVQISEAPEILILKPELSLLKNKIQLPQIESEPNNVSNASLHLMPCENVDNDEIGTRSTNDIKIEEVSDTEANIGKDHEATHVEQDKEYEKEDMGFQVIEGQTYVFTPQNCDIYPEQSIPMIIGDSGEIISEDIAQPCRSIPIPVYLPLCIIDDGVKSTFAKAFSDFSAPCGWLFSITNDSLHMVQLNYASGGARISLTIDSNFCLSLKVFNKLVTEHPLLDDLSHKVRGTKDLTNFVNKLRQLHTCNGATDEEKYKQICIDHSLPNNHFCWITDAIRHNKCNLVCKVKRCGFCAQLRSYIRQVNLRSLKKSNPGKERPPFNKLSKQELVTLLKKARKSEKLLMKKLNRRDRKIKKKFKENEES